MINIALFGLGRIGLMHGKNLMRNKNFNLKYVYDINKNLTKNTAKKLKAIPIKNSWLELDSFSDYEIYNKKFKDNTISEFFRVDDNDYKIN